MSFLLKVLWVACLALTCVCGIQNDQDTYLQALQSSQHPDFYGPPSGFGYEPTSSGYDSHPPSISYDSHPPSVSYESHPPSGGYNYEPVPHPEFIEHQPHPHHPVQPVQPVQYFHEYPKHHAMPHYQHQPSVHEWLFNKLKLKLNLFTLGKILLKLLIFKKIVKFIGIICLLLFLPKLGALFKMDEPAAAADASLEMREFRSDMDSWNERLEESARQVFKSLQAYSKRYGSGAADKV